ncbi:unnamed protein product [Mytilus edulis]|uniref:Retrotransposon gag domain-containing protein n=1 Tax=Mytilus edulis TaxID=6550 RepID=A0A8S3Q813_MYTED|nr:unnamed protein product [Mytilus edulis]
MFSNEKKTAKPWKTPDNYKQQVHNKLDSAFEGLDIFEDQQEDVISFKRGYPIEHLVADCDNDTTIPYVDDQPFSQSSPMHQHSNPFVSSWTGLPTLPSSITPVRPSIIHRPLIPSTLSKIPTYVAENSRLQTPQHFAALYPSLPTSATTTTSITTAAVSVSTTTTSVSTTETTGTRTGTGAGAGTTTISLPSTTTNSSGRTVQPSMNIFIMSSILKIEKFKGVNTQNPETWLTNFNQYCSFYDLSKKKSAESFPFHLEGHAKIWYDTVSDSKKQHFDFLIAAFKDRFKDKQHLLDITIIQTHQGRNESVLEFLSRLLKLATNRNISDDILLAVAMNGLKADLKTIVMTKEPKNIEEFRHAANLAEKAIDSNVNSVNSMNQNILDEIHSLKEHIQSINVNSTVPLLPKISLINLLNSLFMYSSQFIIPQEHQIILCIHQIGTGHHKINRHVKISTGCRLATQPIKISTTDSISKSVANIIS